MDQPPGEFQMVRHIFGAVDSPSCCNYVLKRTAEDARGQFSDDTIETVKRDCYVDDLVTSKPSTSEAITLVEETIPIYVSPRGIPHHGLDE
jgi:hypothetical protein